MKKTSKIITGEDIYDYVAKAKITDEDGKLTGEDALLLSTSGRVDRTLIQGRTAAVMGNLTVLFAAVAKAMEKSTDSLAEDLKDGAEELYRVTNGEIGQKRSKKSKEVNSLSALYNHLLDEPIREDLMELEGMQALVFCASDAENRGVAVAIQGPTSACLAAISLLITKVVKSKAISKKQALEAIRIAVMKEED